MNNLNNYLQDGYCIIDYNKTEKKLFAFDDCEIKEMYRKTESGNKGDLFVMNNPIAENRPTTKKIYKGCLTGEFQGITYYEKAGCFKLSDFFNNDFEIKNSIILELKFNNGHIGFIELENGIRIDDIKFEDYFKKLLEEVHKCPSCSKNLVIEGIEAKSKDHFSLHYE